MKFVISLITAIAWLNLGILVARASNELDGATPLDSLSIPVRLLVVIMAPVSFLIYERHIFFDQPVSVDDSSEPEMQ